MMQAQAQFGPRGGMGGSSPAPNLSGAMEKLFGGNSAFSAVMEIQTTNRSGREMTMSGKMAADNGKSRFEMDMTTMKGSEMPPNAVAQIKQMGMDKVVTITRPDQKFTYMVYPGLNAYAETPIHDPQALKPESDFKMETTELGKETVDGHECVKNKVVVTDKEGAKHESTVWNATDLKKFPIKIETTEQGNAMTMTFKDVKLDKPAASEFEPPSDYKKYDSVMAMMREEMMKRMGGMHGPPHP